MKANDGSGNNISGSIVCKPPSTGDPGIPGYSLLWILGIILIATILSSVKITMTHKKQNKL